MKRKNFLKSVIPAAMSAGALSSQLSTSTQKKSFIPPFIKPGDTIGISSPAGFITLEDIQPAIKKLNDWGFKVKTGDTIGKKDFTYGGTDAERLADFQNMLDDKEVKAILCARGGYGSIRIVDQLNFSEMMLAPKWIIGFSDITVLINHLYANFGIASIHSKMTNSFPADWNTAASPQKESIDSIRRCLLGEKMIYNAVPSAKNKTGVASGRLIGGNLRTLENLAGSSSSPCTLGTILFVEDTGEYSYSIDRMFYNLLRSGKLSQLAGLVVGGFKVKQDDTGESFGKTVEEIVLEKVAPFRYPVCFDFPVGHQLLNVALRCGEVHELIVGQSKVTLMSQ